MKRRALSLFLAITLILTLCSGLSLTAAGMELSMGSVGENLTGVFDTTTGQLTISGYGDMDDWTSSSPPWSGMQSMIKSVVLPQGLTSIGGCAFDGCRNLPSITIPSGVTSIGNRAFSNCAILAEVTLPAGVTSIGWNAFEGCAAFTEMTIPDGVTRINAGTFKDCGALSSVTIPDNVTYIGESAFEGCAVLADAEIPESLRYLGDSAFRNCAVLTSVELPEGVTEVGTFTFSGCGALESVELPEGLTEICPAAFENCVSLASVMIPESVLFIEEGAFEGCSALTSVYIPKNVRGVNFYAFARCDSLTEITVDPENEEYSSEDGLILSKTGGSIVQYPTGRPDSSFVIPTSIRFIDSYSFFGSPWLKSVFIPSTVVSIGEKALGWDRDPDGVSCVAVDGFVIYGYTGSAAQNYAEENGFTFVAADAEPEYPSGVCGAQGDNLTWVFNTDSGLLTIEGSGDMADYGWSGEAPWHAYRADITAVSLPEGLTSIGAPAFRGCTALSEITIPDSVVSIGTYAFEGCAGLTEVELPESVSYIGGEAFWHCSQLQKLTILNPACLVLEQFGIHYYKLSDGLQSEHNSLYYHCFGPNTQVTVYGCHDSEKENSPAIEEQWETIDESYRTVFTNYYKYAEAYAKDNGYSFLDLGPAPDYPGGDCGAEGDNLTWVFNTDTGLLSIEGSGAMANYRARTAPWYLYRTAITAVSLPENLTTVGSYAFWFCQSITEVTVPDSVTSLGNHAFASCYALRSVELPDSLTDIGIWTFSYDHALESVSIPNGLTKIGGSVFGNCDGLTAVTIPNSVTDIDVCAFLSCKALSAVTIPDSVTSIGGSAFSDCDSLTGVWVPAGVSNISVSAFGSCDSLTAIDVDPQNRCYSSLNGVLFNKDQTDLIEYPAGKSASSYTVPSGVTTIKEWAFENCVYLTEVILPDSVTTLESLAFFFCDVLSTVTIGSGVTVIEDNAFFNCQGLSAIHVNEANDSFCSQDGVLFNKDKTELIKYPIAKPDSAYTIPYGVERIGAYAFAECGALTAVTIPDSVTEIGENAFQNCIGLTEAAIPGSVQIIGFEAFCDCYALASLTLSEGLQSIESAAFRGCNGLTSVTIPNSVTWLGDSAFSDCWSLTSVTIGSGITAIESSVFNNCAALTSVTIPASVTEIGDKALGWCCADGMSCEKIEGFTIYGCEGTVAQTYAEENGFRFCRLDAFGDVPANSYYAVPVAWAVANDITAGTGENQFSPDMDCTRAQIMTFLWSAAGKPEPTRAESPFSDVPESAYYYKAVLWAVENGVTSGTGGGRFSPNAVCSRAQAVTFLWRAAGQPEPVGENPFEDVKPGDWYYESVLWAVENGITAGTSQNRFSPQMDCTRAQIVTFLYLDLAEAR